MPPRPFPSITGSCACGLITFQLQKPPLFVYACHCTMCQKSTGSGFALHVNIERTAVTVTSITQPVPIAAPLRRCSGCPTCAAILWGNEMFGAPVCDVRVGALDSPGLLEPDWHAFVRTKLRWITLPPDARSSTGHFDVKAAWPRDSLRRLIACLEECREKEKKPEGKKVAGEEEEGYNGSEDEGERTPTGDEAGSEDEESDDAFEERFCEIERRLTERLEMLSLKLDEGAHTEGEEAISSS